MCYFWNFSLCPSGGDEPCAPLSFASVFFFRSARGISAERNVAVFPGFDTVHACPHTFGAPRAGSDKVHKTRVGQDAAHLVAHEDAGRGSG